MTPWPRERERRTYVRIQLDIPATLYLQSSDDLRRTVRMFSLSGGGCGVYVPSLENLPLEATHQIRFELPSRSDALFFDCQMVYVETDKEEKGQVVRLAFVHPRAGYQDAVVSYIQNRDRFDRVAFKVAMPIAIEAQAGLRQFVPYKGTTVEAGRDYALSEMPKFQLGIGSRIVATFLGPKFRDEIFLPAEVAKLEYNPANGSYKVRIAFDAPSDQMVEFIRKQYVGKFKAL
jgi:hypothetical protein